MKNKNGFSQCAEKYIEALRKEGRHGTAHVYESALFSFIRFCGTESVSFGHITRERLRHYSQYLYDHRLKLNTISTYMRMIRSIYNRGVEAGVALYVPYLFREVYTGVDVRQKKALPINDLWAVLHKEVSTDALKRTQQIAFLMFQFCGMSFADFAHLEKAALDQNVLRYNRVKTGTSMSVEVLDTAKDAIFQLRNLREPDANCPDYLFSVLSGNRKPKSVDAYREYQAALRLFNNQLKSLTKALGLKTPVTSYSLRHSWATTAKYQGVSIEMISESLGHKSIKTTQIYLKGFGLAELTKVNKTNCSYVKNVGLKLGMYINA